MKSAAMPFAIHSPDLLHSRRDSTDQRIHVLFLIDLLAGIGGAEQALVRTARLLPKERYRCTIGSFRIRKDLPLLRESGCDIIEFPFEHILSGSAMQAAWRISRFIRSQRVDVVHTFFQTADLWGGLIARLSGCPVLVSSRRDMGFLRSGRHRLAYRLLGPMFDQVHVVSEAVRHYTIAADHLDPTKVLVIQNCIEIQAERSTAHDEDVRRELALTAYSHVVVAVGNIRRVKGTDVLIRAAAEVCKSFPRALFLIVGNMHEPDYGRELVELAARFGLEGNVRFHGESDEIQSILKASDVFCLLSRTEGMSNALLEAMMFGLPSVATAVGGTPEVLEDGVSGFLVANEDSHAAAGKINRLLGDRGFARKMGVRARRTIEQRFSAQSRVDDTARSYELSLGARKRKRAVK